MKRRRGRTLPRNWSTQPVDPLARWEEDVERRLQWLLRFPFGVMRGVTQGDLHMRMVALLVVLVVFPAACVAAGAWGDAGGSWVTVLAWAVMVVVAGYVYEQTRRRR